MLRISWIASRPLYRAAVRVLPAHAALNRTVTLTRGNGARYIVLVFTFVAVLTAVGNIVTDTRMTAQRARQLPAARLCRTVNPFTAQALDDFGHRDYGDAPRGNSSDEMCRGYLNIWFTIENAFNGFSLKTFFLKALSFHSLGVRTTRLNASTCQTGDPCQIESVPQTI